MSHYQNINKCRICGSEELVDVISFKEQYLSPTFVESNENNELANIKIPMTVVLCDTGKNQNGCGLLQLRETVKSDMLFKNYFYRSATNATMVKDLQNVVDDVTGHVSLNDGDYVVDIGANDCTMLSNFPPTTNRIGIEPATNVNWDNVDKSITIKNDYFSKAVVDQATNGAKVKVITATAMFYDIDDPNAFVSDMKSILAEDGVICLQLTYLVLLIKNMNFYDICNEHLEYYSLHTLNHLMERHELEIFDASTNHVNGGSIRIFISHKGVRQKTSIIDTLLEEENSMNIFDFETYKEFNRKIKELEEKLMKYILSFTDSGKMVIGLGASTKGNVLIQLFGITKEIFPYISERQPDKVGLRTLGTDIELISEEKARELNPACMIVFPWYFKEEIVNREKEYLDKGGELLFPMPYPHVVTSSGEINL